MDAHRISASSAALVGLVALASAMGVGRFAFTPLLPLMQEWNGLTLSQGSSLAAANYLGYLAGALSCMYVVPAPHRAARGGLVAVALFTAGMGLSETFGAWLVLRFLAGMASAFVLVGVSGWVLPLLAARNRASWSGWAYAGVGVGIFLAGLVGLATGLSKTPPARAWLLLAACSAAVTLAVWRPFAEGTSSAAPPGGQGGAATRETWRLVLCYGAFGFGYIVPATFLPAAARQLVADPAVFGWTWPVFGLAAACSTAATSRAWSGVPPRKLWAGGQLVMAVGLLAPAVRMSLPTLMVSAVCVGGTFMVVTMAGLQEARRVAGHSAPRLMAAMTAAFALGQLIGPFTVKLARSSGDGSVALPYAVAAAVLLLGALALVFPPERAGAPRADPPRSGIAP